MKKSMALTFLMLLLLFNMSVLAQDDDEEEVEQDKAEFTFSAGFGIPSGDLSDWGGDSLKPSANYNLGFEGGFFLNSSIVLGGGFTYTSFKIDSQNELTTDLKHRLYSPSVYLKYYFPMDGDFIPYVKGAVGADFLKFTTWITNVDGSRYRQTSYDPALAYSIGLGAFYYTADYSGFYVEANYRIAQSEDVQYHDVATFGVKATTLDIHAGFRVLIGSDE